jgi:hypothetical protein
MIVRTSLLATHLVPALLLLSATACGAEPEMVAPANPGVETMPNPPEPGSIIPEDAIQATQGTVATIGGCACGIAEVSSDHAVVSTASPEWPETKQRLRKGELLNACGALHRVLGFGSRGSSGRPGGSGRFVAFDRQATTTVALKPGAMTLGLGGDIGPFGPGNVILKELAISGSAGMQVARFKVRYQGSERELEARVGDQLELGSTRHRLLDIKPPDATLGIPGWIEIEIKPVQKG